MKPKKLQSENNVVAINDKLIVTMYGLCFCFARVRKLVAHNVSKRFNWFPSLRGCLHGGRKILALGRS